MPKTSPRASPPAAVPPLLWLGIALFPLLFVWPLFASRASLRAKLTGLSLLLLEIGLMIYAMEGAQIFEAVRMLQAL